MRRGVRSRLTSGVRRCLDARKNFSAGAGRWLARRADRRRRRGRRGTEIRRRRGRRGTEIRRRSWGGVARRSRHRMGNQELCAALGTRTRLARLRFIAFEQVALGAKELKRHRRACLPDRSIRRRHIGGSCRQIPAERHAIGRNVGVKASAATWMRAAAFVTLEGSRTSGADRKSTRLNSSHIPLSRMPSSA